MCVTRKKIENVPFAVWCAGVVVVLLKGNKRPTEEEENAGELQVEPPTYLVDRITAAWQLMMDRPNWITQEPPAEECLPRRCPSARMRSEQRSQTSLVVDVFLEMENFSRRHFMVIEQWSVIM